MCRIALVRIPPFTLRGFKRPREAVAEVLGALEREVMEIAWRRGEVSVRDVSREFEERVAYTTLMTTLHRLYRKGMLERRKRGRAYLYAPRVSPAELAQGIARDVIEGLIGSGPHGVEPILACIVETVSEHDRAALEALDRLVREKKEELRRRR